MTNKKFIAIVLAAALMASIGISIAVLENTDMPGSDIASFVLSAGDPSTTCEQRCTQNSSCRAWTYVKPGIWGAEPHCLLKGSVPQSVPDQCCTSGVKGSILTHNIPTDLSSTNPPTANQSTDIVRSAFDRVAITHFPGSARSTMLAQIECIQRYSSVGFVRFIQDGDTLPANAISGSYIIIYYYYSRYNDILALLEKDGLKELVYDPINPDNTKIYFVSPTT